MGWYDDFFNEAVRQDLGKSGIKVAETVEIQTAPTEWWRLISSASPATVRGFVKRREPSALIEGGEVHLAPLPLTETVAMPFKRFWNFPNTESAQLFTFSDGTKVLASWTCRDTGGSNTKYAYLDAYNITTESRWSKSLSLGSGTLLRTYFGSMFFDSVNDRIVVIYAINMYGYHKRIVRTYNANGSQLSSYTHSSTGQMHANLYATLWFPEEAGKIYTIFWTDGGTPSVKITTPTVGVTPYNLAYAVTCTTSGAVSVSGFANVTWSGSSPRVHMFYFRKYASVAIAWYDETEKRIKYALETDDWGTAYTLPDIFTEDPSRVTSIGNFVSEVDGEFVTALAEQDKISTLQTPPGYSYPANLQVLGICKGVGEDDFLLFGNVGSNLYSFTVDGTTLEATPHGVVHASWSQASGTGFPILLAKQGDLALIIFHHPNMFEQAYNTTRYYPTLILYDTANAVVVWEFYGSTHWLTYMPFVSSVRDCMYNFFSTEQKLLMFSFGASSSTNRAYWALLNLSDVFNCETVTDFGNLVLANRKSYTQPSGTYVFYVSGWEISFMGPWSSLALGENEEHFIMPYAEGHPYPASRQCRFIRNYLRKSDSIFETYRVSTSFSGEESSFLQKDVGLGLQRMRNRINPENDMSGGDNTLDGWWKRYPDSQSTNPARQLWYNIAGQYRKIISDDLTGLTHANAYRKYMTHIGKKDQSFLWAFRIGYPTIYRIGADINGSVESSEYGTTNAGFNIRAFVVDEWNDKTIVIGDVDGNAIPVRILTAKNGPCNEIRGYGMESEQAYTFVLEEDAPGGHQVFRSVGSSILWRDYCGRFRVIDSGVPLDLWATEEESPGESPAVPIIYDYEDMEFVPYPFAREGIRAELSNISKTTQVTLPETQTHFIKGLLAGGFDPRGARCILRRIFPDYMAEEGGSIILLDGYIQEWTYSPDRQGIIFTVSKTLLDVNNAFPKRLMNMGCGHVFRGSRCQYIGATGLCPKTKAFCTSLGNVNQFGGFPWVAARQRRVMWR